MKGSCDAAARDRLGGGLTDLEQLIMAMTKMNPSGPDGVQSPDSSGITVIIIGLGYAGSVAAVECHRKGHKVIIFEQAPEIKALGTTSRSNSRAGG